MKVDIVKLIVALATSGLISYGCYSLYGDGGDKILFSIITFVFLAVTSAFSIGISSLHSRSSSMVKITSGVFFIIGVILALIFALTEFSIASVLITNGVVFLTYVLIANSIWKTRQ